MRRPFDYSLYLVTNEEACLGRPLLQVVEQAVKGGVDLVQLREKRLSHAIFLRKALQLKELLDRYRVPLIINDNLLVAQSCGAAGIHVGNSDVAPRTIRNQWQQCGVLGYSVEQEDQIHNEHAELSDYIALSPVFSTATKTDTITEWGLEGIRRTRMLTSKPIVAIGNVNLYNARQIVEAGADCLAVVSAICSAADPARAAEELRNVVEKCKVKQP
ncbi:thiamine phosphate synthase [Telluribacter humicola]|uniref:thiamine phosphate synthase n=1 Tax=Telluribacter humicola TaxID=1720261 RepID=UPI001A968912|nr:thiamine phosphate synthase [Telluribacter humicola]